MNNLFWIFICALSGLFCILLKNTLEILFDLYKQYRNRHRFSGMIRYKEKLSCKEPHEWDHQKLAMNQLPVAHYDICTKCGLVGGTKYMLNKAAMEIFHNNLKARQEKRDLYDRYSRLKEQQVHDLMNKLIRNCVMDFPGDISANIGFLQQFFRKSVIELDVVYEKLNKDLAEEDRSG